MLIGEVVRATCGRDKERTFFIVGEAEGYLLLADGRHRKLEKPKRKKSKHTEIQPQNESAAAGKLARGEKVTNKELWQALATYREGL